MSESRTISYDSATYWGDTTFVSIVKFDKHGNIERMNRFFLGTEKTSIMCSGIINTDDGGYLLAGHTSFANDPDHHPYFDRKSFIIKVDSLFSKEWTSVFNRCVNFIINKTVINNSSSGGYLFASS